MDILIIVVAIAALFATYLFGKWRGKKRAEWEAQPTPMVYLWGCTCGFEKKLDASESVLGSMLECPRCAEVWGHLYQRKSGRALWLKVTASTD